MLPNESYEQCVATGNLAAAIVSTILIVSFGSLISAAIIAVSVINPVAIILIAFFITGNFIRTSLETIRRTGVARSMLEKIKISIAHLVLVLILLVFAKWNMVTVGAASILFNSTLGAGALACARRIPIHATIGD